mgnify:CR=1 FL=1
MPGNLNAEANALTSFDNLLSILLSFLLLIMPTIRLPNISIWSSFIPLLVNAGVPILIPDVILGGRLS